PLMTIKRGTEHLGTEGDWAKQALPEREYNGSTLTTERWRCQESGGAGDYHLTKEWLPTSPVAPARTRFAGRSGWWGIRFTAMKRGMVIHGAASADELVRADGSRQRPWMSNRPSSSPTCFR